MKDYKDEQSIAWNRHHAKFHCEHPESEVRKQTVRGGGIHYVLQCQVCGQRASSAIARDRAIELAKGREPMPFDDALVEAWDKRRADNAAEITRRFDRSVFSEEYSRYLAGPIWAEKRRRVMERAGNICEGCGDAVAQEVHHLSYRHVGEEFLFELVAVCYACHDRLHENDDAAKE